MRYPDKAEAKAYCKRQFPDPSQCIKLSETRAEHHTAKAQDASRVMSFSTGNGVCCMILQVIAIAPNGLQQTSVCVDGH